MPRLLSATVPSKSKENSRKHLMLWRLEFRGQLQRWDPSRIELHRKYSKYSPWDTVTYQNSSAALNKAKSSWPLADKLCKSLLFGAVLKMLTWCWSQTNLRIFDLVLQIQKFIASLPAQILRQQPIYFIDALGLEVPFHLEFVYSPEVSCRLLELQVMLTLLPNRCFMIGCSGAFQTTEKRSSMESLL